MKRDHIIALFRGGEMKVSLVKPSKIESSNTKDINTMDTMDYQQLTGHWLL